MSSARYILSKKINWDSFKGTNTIDVIEFYNKYLDDIHMYIADIVPRNEELTGNALHSFCHIKIMGKNPGYWLHPDFDVSPYYKNRPTLLIKCAALNGLDREICNKHGIRYDESIYRGKLGKLIYTVDKHDSIRHDRDDHIARQVSNFTPYIEWKSSGSYLIRFQGSKDGKEKNRIDNIPYLKLLSNGPDNMDKDLACHVNGRILTPYKLTNHTTGEKVLVTDWEVHHILCKNNESILKTNEPSVKLSTKNFRKFTHETHIELLGSIVLGVESHSALHDSNTNDCIDYWFNRKLIGECKSLPFHYISEENYNKTILWLSENTDYFELDMAPTYTQFIEMHSAARL